MEYKDYYRVLDVGRDASQDEIKRAYRKLARKYHPDVSAEPDAEERFKELQEAYEVLKDPEKRAAYDQLGHNWKQGQDFDPPPGWDTGFEFSGGGFTNSDASGFSDFFESLFGGPGGGFGGGTRRSGPTARGGRDHHARIAVDLEDAFHGAERTISLRMPQLDASGHVVEREHKLNVKIPKGIRPGQQIRLSGQGGKGSDGRAGDLYLTVEFKPHRLYRVEGKDLFLELPIAPWEAALGATVKVPTPAGAVDMTVPAGSRGGQKLRLKGRGLPGKPAGDLYAVLRIAVPPADNDRARALYRQMRDELDFDPRAGLATT